MKEEKKKRWKEIGHEEEEDEEGEEEGRRESIYPPAYIEGEGKEGRERPIYPSAYIEGKVEATYRQPHIEGGEGRVVNRCSYAGKEGNGRGGGEEGDEEEQEDSHVKWMEKEEVAFEAGSPVGITFEWKTEVSR